MPLAYIVKITDKLLRFDTTNDFVIVQLLPFAQTPNAPFEIHKTSFGDGHSVTIQTAAVIDSTNTDFLLPNGDVSITLDDVSNWATIRIPANGFSPAFVSMGGAGGDGGGGGGGGLPPGSGVAPPDVQDVSATGSVDPNTGLATVQVRVTPPQPAGTFTGCHLYCEIPDQSVRRSHIVGSTPIGSQPITGPWNPTDIGHHPYNAAQQPWQVTFPIPSGVNPSIDVPSRIYAVSYSTVVENTLVEANQAGYSPNSTFTLVPGTTPDASGTNITTITTVTGDSISLVVDVEAPVNIDGKLQTPFVAIVSDTPQGVDGWGYRLILTYDGTDPSDPSQQFVLTGYFQQAGIVPSGPADGIPYPHSFRLDTPKTVTRATVWLQAGLVDSSGHFTGNNIVPGVTPSCPVVYGSTVGTTDASAIMISTVDQSMAVVNGLFGIASDGVTNTLLGPGAVSTINIQALAVTNPLLAQLAVAAGNIQTSAVGNPQLAALAVAATNLQASSVIQSALAPLAVATANLQLNAVTAAVLAPLAVAAANLQTQSVGANALAMLAVATANMQASSVTTAILGAASVTAAAIASAAVGTAAIQLAAVGTAAIQAASITAAAMGSAAVGTAAIQFGAITNALIANLAVSGAQIQQATITGAQIAFATIADANIGSVSASKITGGTITATISMTAPNITGGTITSAVINASTINGAIITGSVSLTSPTITGGSITGATLVLDLNNVVTSIQNFSATGPTTFVGVEVKNKTTLWKSRMAPEFVCVSNGAGGTDFQTVSLSVTSAGGLVTGYGNSPNTAYQLDTVGAGGRLGVYSGASFVGPVVMIDASQPANGGTATIALQNSAGISINMGGGSLIAIGTKGNVGVAIGSATQYAFYANYGTDIYSPFGGNPVYAARYTSTYLLINDGTSSQNQRVRLDANFQGNGSVVLGLGFTDTRRGFLDLFENGMQGYGTGNNLAYGLVQSAQSTACGAMYLYNSGSELFRLDAANIRAATANPGGAGTLPTSIEGYFIMYYQGAPKKVPYYSS